MRFTDLKLALGAVGVIAALAMPFAAHADILYTNPKATAIYAARDDGSHRHQLLSVSQVPGMTSISDPELGVSGHTAYLMFDGYTGAYQSSSSGSCGSYPYSYYCTTFYSGIEASGLYKVVNGTLTRISGRPQKCAAGCTTASERPEPAGNGKYYYDQWGCTGTLADQDFTCAGRIYEAALTGGPNTAFESTCTGLHDEQNFAPDPVNASRLAFEGCPSSGGQELDVAGKNEAGEVVIGTAASGTNVSLNQPNWRPDGGRIIAYQGGADETYTPGLYSYNPAGGPTRTRVLYAPLDPNSKGSTKIPYVFSDPRYIGENRIMFTADNNLYTISAACGNCNFPAVATLLIPGATGAFWTPLSLTTTATAPKFLHLALAHSHVTPSQGFTLKVKLNEAAKLVVGVSKVEHKKVHGRRHTSYRPVGIVGGNAAAGAGSYTVKKVHGHKLKAGTYRLSVYATAAGKRTGVRHLTLTVT